MSALRQALADYLRLRRALGYKLERAEQLLAQFIAYLEAARRARRSRPSWRSPGRRCPPDAHPSWWAIRLSVVRGFAAYLQTPRPGHRGAGHAICCRDVAAAATPYLYSEAEIAALMAAAGDACGRAAPSRDLPDADRAARGHRDAGRRGDPARPRRHRPGQTDADRRPPQQVRQVARAAAAREHRPAPARYLRARRPSARSPHRGVVHLHRRHPAALLQRRTRRSGSWSTAPRCSPARPAAGRGSTTSATASPSAPCSTGTATAATSRPGWRLLSTYLGHVDPATPTGISRRRRSCCARRRAARAPPRRSAMSALAPTLQAFFTERLIRQRQASPHTIAAYRDTLPAAARLRRAATGKQPSPARARRSRRAADRRVPRPPRARARQQRRAPATPGWRRSTRCSASPRCATPSTPP